MRPPLEEVFLDYHFCDKKENLKVSILQEIIYKKHVYVYLLFFVATPPLQSAEFYVAAGFRFVAGTLNCRKLI